jgi:glycosyltransferase involved in cell wall biosynthesis
MGTKVMEMELAEGIRDVSDLGGFDAAFILLRIHGHPVGTVTVPCSGTVLSAADVARSIEADEGLRRRLVSHALRHWLLPGSPPHGRPPTWSVIVCTRNRPDELHRCIESIHAADIGGGEIIVVDNGPSDDSTERRCADLPVRYVREMLAGHNRARHRGALEATGEVLLYTDDDIVVDPRWISAILGPYTHSRVGAVTGPALPLALDTESQQLFERLSSFVRGFNQRVFDWSVITPTAAGAAGCGANMSFRRDLVTRLGLFKAELDGGTPARTGGDTYALYRLLAAGYQIVYTPDALVWHEHRRDRESLRRQLYDWSVGGWTVFTRCLLEDREPGAVHAGWRWLREHYLARLKASLLRHADREPADLLVAEFCGIPAGVLAYWRCRSIERGRPDDAAVMAG